VSQNTKIVVTSLSLAVVLASAVALVVKSGLESRRADIQFRQMVQLPQGAAGNSSISSVASPQPSVRATNQRPAVSSERVQQLGFSLMSTPDPKDRVKIADTFGQIALSGNASSVEPGPQEPKMVDLLQAAYSQERDPSVRRAIVTNASAFNHTAALELINSAAEHDLDESVRRAALEARKARENRLVLAGSTEFPSQTWR